MNNILSSLYNCAMESRSEYFLMHDELRDYKNALRSSEELEEQLEELLKEEPLRLFKLYIGSRNDEGSISSISAFRRGLAMGLKLGAYCLFQQ